jgi:hypothetical protein
VRAPEAAYQGQERLTAMPDRILTNKAAQTLQDESDCIGELLTWVVTEMKGSARVIARPIAEGRGALRGALVAATLAELHTLLPVRLKRSRRQPAASPGMVEIWYSDGP